MGISDRDEIVMLVVAILSTEGHVDAKGFVLYPIINGIIDSLTKTHSMTKENVIVETTDLSQDYHEQTRVYTCLHKRNRSFLVELYKIYLFILIIMIAVRRRTRIKEKPFWSLFLQL